MPDFLSLFAQAKPIIGMIHVEALPGTPRNQHAPREILRRARTEAERYAAAGVDGLMIENMHDIPYLPRQVGPEIVSMMSLLGQEVKRVVELPCGLQILAGANQAALAVAHSAGLDFVRAEGFVFGHVADEGWLEADAGALLRYRKAIGAEHIAILTDIKKKHSAHALTADVSLAETAKAAEFFLSDGLVVTGLATGHSTDPADLQAVRAATSLPVCIGSGLHAENIQAYLPLADAFIVGSSFKVDGNWQGAVSQARVTSFMQEVKHWRAHAKLPPRP